MKSLACVTPLLLASVAHAVRPELQQDDLQWQAYHQEPPLVDNLVDKFQGLLGRPRHGGRDSAAPIWKVKRGVEAVRPPTTRRVQRQPRGKPDGKLSKYDLRSKAVDPSELGVDPGVKQYSGYLDDNENDKHLFYWFFESRNDPKTDPVVLWLHGGPGCSGVSALFLSLGPSSIENNLLQLKPNPYSLNNNASVIFLDQPVNTGYSYSSRSVGDTPTAMKDVYALLSLFFHQFPEYAYQDFHIAGGAYSGHFIPVLAHEVLSHEDRNINLKSIILANPEVDPLNQYPEYQPMVCGKGGYGMILPQETCQAMADALPLCETLIKSCYASQSTAACVLAADYCDNVTVAVWIKTGRSPFHVEFGCESNNGLCLPEFTYIETWLNQRDVMDALGVQVVESFQNCNQSVRQQFYQNGDTMKPYVHYVPPVLDKIPVFVYAGDAAFLGNWLGNWAWTNKLRWPGQPHFVNKPMVPLIQSAPGDGQGHMVGKIKSAGNLTFATLIATGVMSSHDRPDATWDLFNRWLSGEWRT